MALPKSSPDDDGILEYYRVRQSKQQLKRESKQQSSVDPGAGDTTALDILTFLLLHGPTPGEKIQAALDLGELAFEEALKNVFGLGLVEADPERPDTLALTPRGKVFASPS